jgi:hypothetical protein
MGGDIAAGSPMSWPNSQDGLRSEMTALVAPFDLVQRTCAKTRRQFDPGDSG